MCVEIIASAFEALLFRKVNYFENYTDENYTDAFRLVEKRTLSHHSKL